MESSKDRVSAPKVPAPSMARAMVRLPAVDLLVLLGSFLITLGALGALLRYEVAGAAILALGLYLFWDEGRWSRALIGTGSEATSTTPRPRPWWKGPITFTGRWLCTSCGWRQESRSTLCPRCGKPMVVLPPPSAPSSGNGL